MVLPTYIKYLFPNTVRLISNSHPFGPPYTCISKEQSIFKVRNSIAAGLLICFKISIFLSPLNFLNAVTELAQIIYIFKKKN